MKSTIITIGNGGYNIAADCIESGIFSDYKLIVCDSDIADLNELFEFGKGYTLTGTGVGLYHIKDIVEKDLQGTVTIESEPQKGFALHVRFGKV